jgi:nucleotide-binding universal stress UspA family protein
MARYVAVLANRFHSRVLTLHASGNPGVLDEPLIVGRVRRIIGAQRTRHITRFGDPVEAIADTARDERADVIVMSTRGVSPFRRLWTRSVTAAVVGKIRCPVITCAAERTLGANRTIDTVLCATALGPDSSRVVQWAAQLARSVTADLAVVHSDARLQLLPGRPGDAEYRSRIRRTVHNQLKRAARDAGADGADLWIEGDKPGTAIAQVAGQLAADLVVIGRSPGAGPFQRGAKCYDIARQAACPVAII